MLIRTSTPNVAMNWSLNNASSNHGKGNFYTDGDQLFSYRLLIGITIKDKKVLFDYSSAGQFRSMTTSHHVGYAKRAADVIIDPSDVSSLCNHPVIKELNAFDLRTLLRRMEK